MEDLPSVILFVVVTIAVAVISLMPLFAPCEYLDWIAQAQYPVRCLSEK